ncbi:MAG TPA: hypothetical protein VIU40_13915 [Geobacteraceae bacterium]
MPFWPDARDRERLLQTTACSNMVNWYKQTGIAPLFTSGAWSSGSMAIYTPILVPKAIKIAYAAMINGAVVAGNYDIGIYYPDAEGKPGVKLWSSGSVAQAVVNIMRTRSLTGSGIWVPEGLMYMALAMDGTTGTCVRLCALTTDGSGPIEGGIFTEAAAFPLPATATPSATPVVANVPILAAWAGGVV